MITTKELDEMFAIKQMERLAEKAERVQNTINFCDGRLTDKITNRALNLDEDDDTMVEIIVTKPNTKNNSCYPVEPDGQKYADGTISRKSTDEWLDFDTLIAYCKTNGFKLYSKSSAYYHYGSGSFDCIVLAICWNGYERNYWNEI